MKARTLVSLALALVLTLACSVSLGSTPPTSAPPTAAPAVLATQAVVVVTQIVVQQVTSEAAEAPTAPGALEAPTAANTGCNRLAVLDSEDPPYNARIKAGQNFQKTWTLINTGTCTWDSSYRLVFAFGDQMAAANEIQPLVRNTIPPGSSLTIYINMRAPSDSGQYSAAWSWLTGNGDTVFFDIGGDTAEYLYASITVP